MRVFYQVQDGKVVGWTSGTDIAGDPSSTKEQMAAWQAEDPQGRQVIAVDPEKEFFRPVDASLLKVQGGSVVMKTEKEIQAEADAASAAAQQAQDDLEGAVSSLKAKLLKLGLTDEEADMLIGPARR